MRAIAEFAMRGRKEASVIAFAAAALPLFFWISAALVGLTFLRKGLIDGFLVLMWALWPSLVWLVTAGDPTQVLVMVITTGLALVLRMTVSLVYTLLAAAIFGVLTIWALDLIAPAMIEEVLRLSSEMLKQLGEQLEASQQQQFDAWLRSFVAGSLGAVHVLVAVSCLFLARWWQATLYNPGGFQKEFHQLLLPKWMAVAFIVLMVIGGQFGEVFMSWLPSLSIPFVITGLAMVHGIVGISQLGGHWLFAFYISVIFVGPQIMYTLLIFVAVLDSFFNFRQRVKQEEQG